MSTIDIWYEFGKKRRWSNGRAVFFFVLIATWFSYTGYAQQPFLSGMSQFDTYSLNPAYGGMDGRLSLTGSYRAQWQSLDGYPQFLRINGHVPLYAVNGASGIMISRESIGLESNLRMSLSYNQVFALGQGLFSAGLKGGLVQKQLDGSQLITTNGNYENGTIDHQDDFIPTGIVRGIAPIWGIGLYYSTRSFDFGIVFDDFPVIAIAIDGRAIQKWQSISVHGKYLLNLSGDIALDFYGLVRSDFVQWQAEAGIVARLNDRWFALLQIRGYSEDTMDAVTAGVGGRLNDRIEIAYHYDITLSPLRQVSNGAHELSVRYLVDVNLGKKVPEKILYGPRLYD